MTKNVSRAATREDGQGLIELVVALTILAIGIGSLLTLLSSSALSLQRTDQKGTALVLAEKQIELYRSDGYRDIRLDDTLVAAIPASSVYMTANSSDSTIPSGATGGPTGQRLDTASDSNPCLPTSPLNPTPDNPNSLPLECLPVQTVPGPDHRQYEIDTYIHTVQPNGGDWVALVTVVVRSAALPSRPILARSASSFSSVNVANVNGKSIIKLSFSAPKADTANNAVSASSISATLSNTNAASGQINFYVLPPPFTPSSPCGTVPPWVSLGPASVNGNGTYHPSGNYPASGAGPAAGTYYWYATYTGDSQNKKASSVCGASTAKMTVQAGKWSPSLSVSTTASTGVTNVAISGSAITAALSASSGTTTGAITYSVYGPSATAPATCGSGAGWSTIGTVTPNGDGSYNPAAGFTPTSVGTYWYYASFVGDGTNNAAASLCNSSMAKTVVTTPPDTFGFSAIGSQTAGTGFTVATITAQLYSGGTDTTYTGSKTLTFTGPGTSPNGNAPTYPATVTFTNGIASAVPFTLYKAETTMLTATQGAITGSTGSFAVAGRTTAAFTIDPVGAQTAGTAFGVNVRAVDVYGNPSTYSGTKTVSWLNPGGGNSPNGTAPVLTAATETSLAFTNVSGQGVATATGVQLYLATNSSALKVTETGTGYNGTSANFVVNAAAASSIAFINCTQPTSANTTCASPPFSTGNNGTLQANVALKDTYGNTAVAASAITVNLTSSSTTDYTVSPASVTIAAGGSQSQQLTVTPAQNNPSLTTITAHATSGGFADKTVQVQK
jgi:type II secretory pathway pseudopilin PulG